MVDVLDENGRVFGVVNVVDLLVVLLVVAVGVAGVALVLGDGNDTEDEPETVTISVQSRNVQPYVARAVPQPGPVRGGNVVGIENRSVTPTRVVVTTADGELLVRDHPRLKTVRVTVTVRATQSATQSRFAGGALGIGREVQLDMGSVELRGNVTEIETETG